MVRNTQSGQHAQLSKRVCRSCKLSFIPHRRTQAYCTDACRAGYYKTHFGVYPEAEKICPQCGTTFRTRNAVKQRYCCPDCRKAAQRARIEKAIVAVSEPASSEHCEHYWIIETPSGPQSRAICKLCGNRATFSNSFPASYDYPGTPNPRELLAEGATDAFQVSRR